MFFFDIRVLHRCHDLIKRAIIMTRRTLIAYKYILMRKQCISHLKVINVCTRVLVIVIKLFTVSVMHCVNQKLFYEVGFAKYIHFTLTTCEFEKPISLFEYTSNV